MQSGCTSARKSAENCSDSNSLDFFFFLFRIAKNAPTLREDKNETVCKMRDVC